MFIRDGDVWTSAGITAGIDLSLALVDEDLGPELALAIARELVVVLKRPGGQWQFSSRALRAAGVAASAARAEAWIAGHLEENLWLPALAERALMIERTFAWRFTERSA